MNITISRASRADYDALARHHYRPARPAAPVLTLAAREHDTLLGVLVVTMPTLNAPWRRTIWPELFGLGREKQTSARLSPSQLPVAHSPWPPAKAQSAARINTHLRTIARVIIDPRFRALGVARRLVAHYLANPLTTHTEAVAAMGHACPFFERAGMRPITPPPSRRDTRLALILRQFALEPWELIDLTRARSCLEASAVLKAEVWRWALESKSTRRHLPIDPSDLTTMTEFAALAGASLTARPLVYVANTPR